MKKVSIFLFSAVALAVSCQIEQQIVVEEQESVQQEENLVYKTFTVSMPDSSTKTYLDSDGHAVKWSVGDEINVIEAGTGINRTFTLKSGEDTNNAIFEGTVTDGQTSFYAVYPNVPATYSSAEDKITISSSLGTVQNAVAGGFDSHYAVMTAESDAYGNFAFRHGVAYFKIQISEADIKTINLKTSNTRFGGAPIFTASTGAFVNINSAKDNITLSAGAGTFIVDEYYYIPVPVKNSSVSTLTLTFENSSGVQCVKTSESLSSKKLALGKIYNLGKPSVSFNPIITAGNVNIESSDESGTIDFTVSNLVDGGNATAEVLAGATISNLSLGAISFNSSTGVGSVGFDCDANTDTENSKTATVRITYTYNEPEETVTKDVVITQDKALAAGAKVFYYYYTTSLTNTESKFTPSAAPGITFDGSTSNCGVTSFEIDGKVCTKGLKLNSGAYLDFTTSEDVTASVTFYYACRKSGDNDSAAIKITPTSPAGSATVFDGFNTFGTISFQTVNLDANTTYRIERDNRELALVYVSLTETPTL